MTGPEIVVDGTFNLRDLGGLAVEPAGRVRTGLLFRSGSLKDVTAEGAGRIRALGLRTVIDLREAAEDNRLPVTLADGEIVHRTVPIYRGRFDWTSYDGLDALYTDVLRNAGDALVEAVGELARPGALPALVHCSAGKDRTGLVIGLLLSLLGVPDEVVAADFALTERYFVGDVAERALAGARAAGMTAQKLALISGAAPELMHGVLKELRSDYGGSERYALERGLAAGALAHLRQELVAPGPRPVE